MKTYKNETDTMIIEAFEENSKYILKIKKYTAHICGTRSGKHVIEKWWDEYRKEFNTAEQANRYFKGIKKNNPTLKAN